MYASMPPWWFNPPSNQEMTPKDFLEFIKMFDEWKQSQKPKEEKKPDLPKLNTWDYFIFICAFHSAAIIIATTLILYNLTQFMKAIPH